MLDFPNSPTTGQTFTAAGITWKWDGAKWTSGSTAQAFLPIAGGTMSGDLVLAHDPPAALDAATKQYVDAGDVNSPSFNNVGRNLINNSMMRVAQRGNGAFTAASVYTLDQWLMSFVSDTMSVSRTTLPLGGSVGDEAMQYCLSNTFTGNSAAGAMNIVVQRVEGVARTSGKTLIISFYASATAALKLGVNFYQSFGTGGSPSAGAYVLATGQQFTMAAGSAWSRYSFSVAIPSIVGKTLGSNGDDYCQIMFWFSSGANNNQTAGNIGVQSGGVNLWGVQVEIAMPNQTQPSPLEKPDPATELVRCQRYFQSYTSSGGGAFSVRGYSAAAGLIYSSWIIPQMRASPTVAMIGAWGYSNASGGVLSAAQSNSVIQIYATVTATGVGSFNNPSNGGFTLSAEL